MMIMKTKAMMVIALLLMVAGVNAQKIDQRLTRKTILRYSEKLHGEMELQDIRLNFLTP